MFGLLLPSGYFLDFSDGTFITLNLTCPIFDPDSINREWSFPITIPRTPRNERELRAGRIDTVLVGRLLAGTLYIEGLPWENGVIKVTGATQNDIKVVFQSGAIEAKEFLEKSKLQDLSIPVTIAEPFVPVITLRAVRQPLVPGYVLVIRINGVVFQRGFNDPQTFVDDVNAAHPGLLTLLPEPDINTVEVRMNAIDGIEQLEVELYPALDFAPAELPSYFDVYDHNYLQEYNRIAAAYEARDFEAADLPFRLPTLYAPDLYDGKNTPWRDVANRYDPATETYLRPAFFDDEGWDQTLLPFPRATALLEKVATSAGLRLEGVMVDDPEMQELLLGNNRDLANYIRTKGPSFYFQIDDGNPYVESALVIMEPTFNLAEFAPEMSGLDLIQLINRSFALISHIENGRLRQTPIRVLLQGAAEDITDKIEPEYQVSYAPLADYALDYDRQGDETEIPGQLERVTQSTATEATEYQLPAFSYFEQIRDVPERLRLPVTDVVGRNPFFGTSQAARRRLLFYRGLQPDADGLLYPQAGHSLRGFGTEPVGAYSLNWDGPGGLYETWFRELIELLQHGRTDTRLVRLTISDLLELKKWRSVRKYYRTEDGTAVGVVRNVRVRGSRAGLELAKVTFQLEPS